MTDDQKKAARIAWAIGLFVLAVIVLVDLGVHHHAHFEQDELTFDTLPEFWPVYGFGAAFVLLIAAKTLAIALKRKDTYYADD